MKFSKQQVLSAVMAITVVAVAADAQAFWGSRGSWGSYGSWGGGSWGSGGGWGSYGSYGGRGRRFFGGSHGSYGGQVVYYNSCGSHGGVIYESAPVEVQDVVPPDAADTEAAPGSASYGRRYGRVASRGSLRVTVPAGAKVYVNDKPTKSTGVERHYVSHGLRGGQTYSYTVRAEFKRDGKPVVETKVAKLVGGGEARLVFSAPSSEPVAETGVTSETTLTLTVPADAKVTLAGTVTKHTGQVRHFASRHLADGQTWDDYTVLVEVERDGKKLVDERTIKLVGGQSRELVFNLDGMVLAAK